MKVDHLTNHSAALEYLAWCLSEGTLTLVLGAGASNGVGLPGWPDLLGRMATLVGDEPCASLEATARDLQVLADEIREKHFKNQDAEFAQLVKRCLYGDRPLPTNALTDPLLIAMGALMTGSKRGSVRRVMTLNFDCILEWYLHLHGLVTHSVHSLPYLEGAEDVRVFHPHGFLAHSELAREDSEFVILGLDAVDLRLGTQGSPWNEAARHFVRTGIPLFIGMSMRTFRDHAMAPLLKTVAAEVRERPLGFWLFPEGEDVNFDELLRHGVVPLVLNRPAYPDFLLQICRLSARLGSIR